MQSRLGNGRLERNQMGVQVTAENADASLLREAQGLEEERVGFGALAEPQCPAR